MWRFWTWQNLSRNLKVYKLENLPELFSVGSMIKIDPISFQSFRLIANLDDL